MVQTPSLIIKLGRRPGSGGGMNEPRRIDVPAPVGNEVLRSPDASGVSGALISGALTSATLTAGGFYST